MPVREILDIKGSRIVSIGPDAPLPQAACMMVEQDIGSLVVMGGQAMIGMVTFREVLSAVQRHGGDIHEAPVSEAMVRDPVRGAPSDTVDHLRSRMTDNHVRYLPIKEDGRLIGMLSFHDVAKPARRAANFENRLLKQYIKNWPEPGEP